ncbi:acyltransferase family protein [Cryobacterium sp. Y50]|uniref:acyltransferase family protein n=1 Tax=Cryobacterium sp. Y50 TaxID=2048286 RepID=UPI000CE40248|nr:acyltransferase family protein [Cryobacterium sp. Y50]
MTIAARPRGLPKLEQSSRHGSSGFRSDIQGLRAVAVGLVLVFHAGAPFLPGGFVGVDVFFVISGFLITGLLMKEIETRGSISLANFYARRIKRILPAASAVILAAGVMTVALLPRTRWDEIGWQMLGSATYSVNWVLADSVNYLNSEVPPGPLQHFWTLAVEEQFYLFWPLVLIVLASFARPWSRKQSRRDRSAIRATRWQILTGMTVAVLTAASLAWSVYYTPLNPGPAYFITTTRLWELGLGATVAIFAFALGGIPRLVGRPLGWAGLLAILAAGTFYSVETPFPGAAALLPTLGAAAVIVAGLNGHDRHGAAGLLSLRPLTWIGDRSYSLYLWHWPLIVMATFLLDGLSVLEGTLIIVASTVPALISYRYIELPFQRHTAVRDNALRVLQIGGVMMGLTVLASVSLLVVPKLAATNQVDAILDKPLLGAELLAIDPAVGVARDKVGAFVPTAIEAKDDTPALYADGCHQEVMAEEIVPCVYGETDSDFTIAVVGDSHAAHWVPAVVRLANDNGWRVETYTKSSCPLISTVIMFGEGTEPFLPCSAWNAKMMSHLTGPDGPDFVLMSGTEYVAYSGAPVDGFAIGPIDEGYASTWRSLRAERVPFAFLEDTPRSGIDTPECVSANADHLTRCATSRDKSLLNGSVDQLKASTRSGERLINLNERICPDDPCAAVIGRVLVYRDSHHLTATYARSLAPALGEKLRTFPSIPFVAGP